MIPLAALSVARRWWKAGVGAVIGAALVLPVGQCQGRQAALIEYRGKVAEAEARARAANNALLQAQAVQREADAARTAATAKGRSDAIQAGPDGAPSAPELRLACRRLRDQGVAERRLPAGCRSDRPAEAATDR